MSYKEIGEVLNLPVKTVETQLYRGKQMLKALLAKSNEKEAEAHEYV